MKKLNAVLAGTAIAATMTIVAPATSVTASPAPTPAEGVSAYTPHAGDAAQNARLKAIGDAAIAQQKASGKSSNTPYAARVVYYDASAAPSFKAYIDRTAQIWNSATNNVDLVPARQGQRATLTYREGNDSRGSHAVTYQPGNGYVFIDYKQSQEYDKLRIVSHETGHILGLPDNYQGPCSELMSGGGAGKSCTNAVPNARERARVDAIFAGGYLASPQKIVNNALLPAS